jgi:hypothetical protein
MDDKMLHENTAKASEYIICEHNATGCYDTILLSILFQGIFIEKFLYLYRAATRTIV